MGLAFDQHRNLWETENGERGGDELNLIRPGRNYGWPVITWGHRYDDKPVAASTAQEGMEQPVVSWVPAIAPSSIAMYTGKAFPKWNGNLFMGSLVQRDLYRLVPDGQDITVRERILRNAERIRDVDVGPDGYIFLLTDAGEVVRLVPN
jgi:glucose/arabinose dehydrogenase